MNTKSITLKDVQIKIPIIEYDGNSLFIEMPTETFNKLKTLNYPLTRTIMNTIGNKWEKINIKQNGTNITIRYDKVYDLRPWQCQNTSKVPDEEFEWDDN